MKPFFCWGALIMTPIVGFMCDIRNIKKEINTKISAKHHWENQSKTLNDHTKAIENYEDKIQEEKENKTKYEQQAKSTKALIKTPREILTETIQIQKMNAKYGEKYADQKNHLWQAVNSFLKQKNAILSEIEKNICLTTEKQKQYESQPNKISELVTKILNIEFELEQQGFKVILCNTERNSSYLPWKEYKLSDPTSLSANKKFEEKNTEQNYDPTEEPYFYFQT